MFMGNRRWLAASWVKGEGIIEFFDTFKTDLDCLEYLASIKWKDGFKCSKCNHTKYTIRKLNFARDCNLCHHVKSPTANTIFHICKIYFLAVIYGIAFLFIGVCLRKLVVNGDFIK